MILFSGHVVIHNLAVARISDIPSPCISQSGLETNLAVLILIKILKAMQ